MPHPRAIKLQNAAKIQSENINITPHFVVNWVKNVLYRLNRTERHFRRVSHYKQPTYAVRLSKTN